MNVFKQLLLGALAVAAAVPAIAGDIRDFSVFQQTAPAKPLADIWIEGENTAERNRFGIEKNNACFGGSALMSFADKDDCFAAWEFEVKQPGEYLIMLAGAPVGEVSFSPVAWRIDQGDWQNVQSLPRSSKSWGVAGAVHWLNLAVVELRPGKHRLEWKVTAPRREDGRIYCSIIDAIAMIHDPYLKMPPRQELETGVPGNVFSTSMPLTFSPRYRAETTQWEYQVLAWNDAVAASGDWMLGKEPLTLQSLGTGFFRLFAKPRGAAQWICEVPFTVVNDLSGRKLDTHPYSVDGAPSWMSGEDKADPLRPLDTQNVTAAIESIGGIRMVRDRINWEMKPDGSIDWTGNPAVAAIKAKHGVAVCGMIQNAPGWMVNASHIPVELLATMNFCRAAARKFDGQITAWEFWNEPDGSSIPPWEFAAAQKAAYLGFKSGNPALKVLQGSSCLHPVPLYMDIAMENGLSEYFDIYNFHTYEDPNALPASTADERALLERFGVGGKPMWVTENGFSAIGTIQPHARSNKWEHDHKTALLQAEYVAKAQLRLQIAGVQRTFSFLFAPFNEGGSDGSGGKVMGMLRWDFAAKPSYAALTTLIDQFAEAEYLGEIQTPAGSSAYLYQDGNGEQILAFWSDDRKEHALRVSSRAPRAVLVDMLGGKQPIKASGRSYQLTATRYPAYLRGDLGLTPNRPYRKPTQGAFSNAYGDLSVVLALKFRPGVTLDKTKAIFDNGNKGDAVLTVWNLSDAEKRGNISYTDKDFTVSGKLDDVVVPAMSKVEIPISITAKPELFGFGKLSFAGSFNGKTISPLYLPIKVGGSQSSGTQFRTVTLPAEKPERWDNNSGGKLTTGYDAEKRAVSHVTTFPPNADLWTYPGFMLARGESFRDAVGFSFDIKANKNIAFALIMMIAGEASDKKAPNCWVNYKPTTEWQTVNIMFEVDLPRGVKPEAIRTVRIGANPWHESKNDNQYQFWVRNFKIYYRK